VNGKNAFKHAAVVTAVLQSTLLELASGFEGGAVASGALSIAVPQMEFECWGRKDMKRADTSVPFKPSIQRENRVVWSVGCLTAVYSAAAQGHTP